MVQRWAQKRHLAALSPLDLRHKRRLLKAEGIGKRRRSLLSLSLRIVAVAEREREKGGGGPKQWAFVLERPSPPAQYRRPKIMVGRGRFLSMCGGSCPTTQNAPILRRYCASL